MFQYNIQKNIQISLCLTLIFFFSIVVYIPQWDFPCKDEGPFLAVAVYVPINNLQLSYLSAQPSRCMEVASYGAPPIDCVINCVGSLEGISESI